jgi:hypothetical protein
MNKRISKAKMIENHLKSGKRITQTQAKDLYGHQRLSGVIHELRKKYGDYDSIKTHDLTKKDRWGKPCTFAEYELVSTPEDWENIRKNYTNHDDNTEPQDNPNTYDDYLDLPSKEEMEKWHQKQKGKGLISKITSWFNGKK